MTEALTKPEQPWVALSSTTASMSGSLIGAVPLPGGRLWSIGRQQALL